MSKLSFATVLFVIAFMLPAFTIGKGTPAPSVSFTASNQLKYWSLNVKNNMPPAILSKLSPLNEDDSEFFTSLVSKQSFQSNSKFCSLANLACYSELDSIKPLSRAYGYINNPSFFVQKVDPFSFFRMSVLRQGNRVHLSNLEDQFPQRAFLPSQIASKISLVENNLQKIFPQSFINPNTKGNIETTLLYCNAVALKGEIKSCPKSLEDMIEFSKTTLGTKKLVALTSKSTKGSGEMLTIGNIKQLNAKRVVSCHEVYLPFATYFCHTVSSTQLYAVDIVKPETKVPVNTLLAICHMDTSTWPTNHPAFEILKATPSQGEACHWITKTGLLWVGTGEKLV
nr:polygalacturonase non-catalytic subunit AroGP2-like [Coffea arabica]